MNCKLLWNDNWYFAKTDLGVKWEDREQWESGLQPVDLPHDWLIYDTLHLYEDSVGWYQKCFTLEQDGYAFLRFEGVYMDYTVYVNNQKVGDWKYGYSTSDWDITEYLQAGENEVVVRVVHQAPNSRWYSGAGIYRNVWLVCLPKVHIPLDGIYVSTEETEDGYQMTVDTEIAWGPSGQDATSQMQSGEFCLEYTLYGPVTGCYAPETGDAKPLPLVMREIKSLPCGQEKVSERFAVKHPRRWDIDEPNRYRLEVKLLQGEEIWQQEQVTLGFRTIAFLPEQGFLLNGRKVRLQGACDHHDLGALGAAFQKEAMRRKFLLMRSMGVNALRTSHNMPAVEVMELADEMGFLVLSEAFDMWEMAKNPYDYARFFKDWAEKDVRSWIRRDRNHPSVIMWSIGNEIPDTHADAHGQEITRRLIKAVRQWDYREVAPITIGSNYMPWENAQRCADIVKLAGYNYAEKYYDEHHRIYPDWIIYGSETSSVVQSRGVYHFPLERSSLIEEDEQCSALGNSTTSWAAKNAEYCIAMDRDTPYSCGQFIWTAIDYIGEPTPYQTKNSYFGQIDTAGFPKDSYYLFRAEWTDYHTDPMVHVYPYWDFNPGQLIDVRIASNAPWVELFVNGVSKGRRQIDHEKGWVLQPAWKVAYEPGAIEAVAYDEEGKIIARQMRHSFRDTAGFVVKPNKTTLLANGEDMIFVEISAEDAEGYPVENASDYVRVTVEGAGRLLGLDNGDSTDYDAYKGTVRKLFNGRLLAMIAAKTEPGEIRVTVEDAWETAYKGKTRRKTSVELRAEAAPSRQGICASWENRESAPAFVKPGFVPVRKLELSVEQTEHEGQGTDKEKQLCLIPEKLSAIVRCTIYPENATDRQLIWKATDLSGMESRIVRLETQEDGSSVRVTGISDGVFQIRCMTKNGTEGVKLLSQLDMQVQGLGETFVSPYEPVAGIAYTRSSGDVSRGVQQSAGTDRETETSLIYDQMDFGSFGSDELTLAIFANDNDAHKIQIWQGVPGEAGSERIDEVIYQKQSIWEVFQPETFHLSKRLTGVCTVTLVAHDKFFLKMLQFTPQEKAFSRLEAARDGVTYGDSFERREHAIEKIGNNVSLEFTEMDFGTQGTDGIVICGRTPLEQNTVQLRFSGENGETQVIAFPHSETYQELSFPLQPVYGRQKVTFVFLPGCNFDFAWFQFHRNGDYEEQDGTRKEKDR